MIVDGWGYVALGIIVLAMGVGLCWGINMLENWQQERERRRQAAIEAELDRKQAELRSTILSLADALGAEAHEARKALIRESYLSSGRPPNRQR